MGDRYHAMASSGRMQLSLNINSEIVFALLQEKNLLPHMMCMMEPSVRTAIILIKMRRNVQADLLPQVWFKSQTGTRCNKPAVSHITLIQVMRTDAFDEKMRVLGYLLKEKRKRYGTSGLI